MRFYLDKVAERCGEDIASMVLEKLISYRRLGDIFKVKKGDSYFIVGDDVMTLEYYKNIYIRRYFLDKV